MFSFYRPRDTCYLSWSGAAKANHCKPGGLKQHTFPLHALETRNPKSRCPQGRTLCSGSRGEPLLVSYSCRWPRPPSACGSSTAVSAPSSRGFLCGSGCVSPSASTPLLRIFVPGFKVQLVNAEDDLISRSFFHSIMSLKTLFLNKVTFTGARGQNSHISFVRGVGAGEPQSTQLTHCRVRTVQGAAVSPAQHCPEPGIQGHIWDGI